MYAWRVSLSLYLGTLVINSDNFKREFSMNQRQRSCTLLSLLCMTSRVDYCNALYAGAPKTTTDKLQRVLSPAARVVSDTCHGSLTTLLHDELHWLDVPERVWASWCTAVCMARHLGTSPIISHPSIRGRFSASSAPNRHQLIVHRRRRLNTYGCRAFSLFQWLVRRCPFISPNFNLPNRKSPRIGVLG